MFNQECIFHQVSHYTAPLKYLSQIQLNRHTNMRGPRGPRKTLKAAQTVIIGISAFL